jgi:hypothetical protein
LSQEMLLVGSLPPATRGIVRSLPVNTLIRPLAPTVKHFRRYTTSKGPNLSRVWSWAFQSPSTVWRNNLKRWRPGQCLESEEEGRFWWWSKWGPFWTILFGHCAFCDMTGSSPRDVMTDCKNASKAAWHKHRMAEPIVPQNNNSSTQ